TSFENLVYSSWYWGSNVYGITLDDENNVYVTGSSNWIEPSEGAIQPLNGCHGSFHGNPYIARFDPTKSGPASLIYATYFVGQTCGYGEDLVVDEDGNAYVTGIIEGQMTTVTPNAPDRTYGGNGFNDTFL